MNLDKVLAQMRQQHAELGIAIKVFDSMTNGHHQKKRLNVVERAAQLIGVTHGEDGNGRKKKVRPPKGNSSRHAPVDENLAPLTAEETAAIASAIQKGMSFTAAMVAALKAAPRPLFSTELGPILNKRGIKTEKDHNPVSNKAVGVLAAAYARKGHHNIARTEDNRFWITR